MDIDISLNDLENEREGASSQLSNYDNVKSNEQNFMEELKVEIPKILEKPSLDQNVKFESPAPNVHSPYPNSIENNIENETKIEEIEEIIQPQKGYANYTFTKRNSLYNNRLD